MIRVTQDCVVSLVLLDDPGPLVSQESLERRASQGYQGDGVLLG